MNVVNIDAGRIVDWDTFHAVFAETLGFPDFYGKNMNAWIDCMTDVDDPGGRMTAITVQPGAVLTLQLNNARSFAERCPEQYAALVEATAFVNWRRIDVGQPAVLALSFYR